MKIYFSAASQVKPEKKVIYRRIVDWLNNQGHEVFEKVLSQHLPVTDKISSKEAKDWFKEWSAYLGECDVAVFEGSYPGTIHLGLEIGLTLAKGKPTVILFAPKLDPALITKHHSSQLIKSEYDTDNLEAVLSWCLEEAKSLMSRRFTFFIPQEIDAFLEKIVKEDKVSRAEWLRALIEKERQNRG